MPQATEYTVHFGVTRENLQHVVPGVVGLDTRVGQGRWAAWDYDRYPDDYWLSDAQKEELHIEVHTFNPMDTVRSVLYHYGVYLLEGSEELLDSDSQLPIIQTTLRGNDDAPYLKGCVHVLVGTVPLPREGAGGNGGTM